MSSLTLKTTKQSGKKFAAAIICAAALCATGVSAQTLTSNSTGTHNGFYYSFWKDNGDASFQLLEGGRYKSQWSNSNNWVGGKGWNPGSASRVVSYSGSYNIDSSQNSYLALYGWTKNPLIEYYVIESFGSYNPSSCNGGQNYGSFQSDGAAYNVRRCQRVQQPSIEGTATFYQYFSVRTPKKGFGNINGTITVANHFNYWASQGLNLGSHDYMVLATEGYQSRGSSDITVIDGAGQPQQSSSGNTSSASGNTTPSSTDIVVRARGVVGGEHINLLINGVVVANWNLTTTAANYTYTGRAGGDLQVEFDNDSGDLDVILDSVYVNGETRQAEDMEYNTSTYDGECGGGSFSETMHCNGVIGFGGTGDCLSGNCGVAASSSTPPASSSRPPVSSSTPPSSSSTPPPVSSSVASVALGQCVEMCKWYQDAPRPLCVNRDSGWGWENQTSCIGRLTCDSQYGDGGVIEVCDGPPPSSSSVSSAAPSSVPSSKPSSSSSTPSSSSSVGATQALIVAVNTGGQATTYSGVSYQSDTYFSGGTSNSTDDVISAGALFQSERYGSYSYSIPVTAGTYSLKLHFAEIYQTSAGQRSFNVSIEGQVEMSNVDLYTLAGHDMPYTYEVNNVQVNDGSLNIVLETLADNATMAGFAVYSQDGSISSSSSASSVPTVGVSAENPSADCSVPALPSANSLPNQPNLPDPFRKMDGSYISDKSDWRCRRGEILKQAYGYIYGDKPAKPSSVTGTVSNSSIQVNVSENGRSTSFNASVELPSTGQAPYPAVIGFGSSFFGLADGMKNILKSQGVAIVTFDPYQVGAEGSGHGNGRFYDIYGSSHPAGLLTAWAWGASRIVDVMESNPALLDATKIGVSGCSRFGKAAFIAGAFDGRIALTIPNESGIGGVPALKMVPSVDSGGEQPSHAINYEPWFSPSVFSSFANNTARLPVDTHEVIGLIAPRGLLILDNPHIGNLDYRSSHAAAVAGQRIYQALGVANNMSYHSNVSDGNHCAWKSEFAQPLRDHVSKFLKGGSGTTGFINARSGSTTNVDSWIDWQTPTLTGQLDF